MKVFKIVRKRELAVHEPPNRLESLLAVDNCVIEDRTLPSFRGYELMKVDLRNIEPVQNGVDEKLALVLWPNIAQALVRRIQHDLVALVVDVRNTAELLLRGAEVN